MHVFDQEGIVEIDHTGQARHLDQQIVGKLPLGNRHVAVGQKLRQATPLEGAQIGQRQIELAGGRHLPGLHQHHVDAEARQGSGHLRVTDGNAGHLSPQGLAGQQRDPRPSPFHNTFGHVDPGLKRDKNWWTRQARELSMARRSSSSRAISA